MLKSLWNGVNGVKTQNLGVDITANNISNVNTIGFKRTSSEFADIFYQRVVSRSANPAEIGSGSLLSASKVVYEQGSFTDGEGEFDVGLMGKGFFGVRGFSQTYYTRNGEFTRDGNNYLVDASGNFVLGTVNPNLVPTQFSDRVAQAMGRLNGTNDLVTSGFTVNNPNQDFTIAPSTMQTKLFVPSKNMYYFPEVTTQATFKGTLSSRKATNNVNVSADKINITKDNGNPAKYTISGQITTNDIYSAAVGDKISIVVKDKNNKEQTLTGELTAVFNDDGTNSNTNFSFSIEMTPQTDFDTTQNPQVVSANLKTQQDFIEPRIFGARIFNADGSVSFLKYKLEAAPRTNENITFNITAGFYDEADNLISDAGTGTMTFNKNGALIEHTLQSVQNPNGGTISVNFGTPTDTPATNGVGAGWDGIYLKLGSNDADKVDYTSDGVAEGFFSQYQIEKDGSIIVQFTNGKTVTVGKLALYTFINEQGLAVVGGNNFMATSNSGAASFLYDNEGKLVRPALFVGQKLEMSNTDLSTELTNLIVMQRGFEASSKSITTSDSMLQTAIGLKK